MGQIATLYRIGQHDFPGIVAEPTKLDLNAIGKGHESFQQSQEGFGFILSKGQDAATTELVKLVFNPAECIGEVPDFENLDWDNLPPDFNYGEDLIFYNPPNTVAAIAALLVTISGETIIQRYVADELNENGVYPGVWNNESFEQGYAFNAGHLIFELEFLKDIYTKAAAEGDYVLSFVG